MMNLPYFRYHPDPIASRAIEQKAGRCICCNKQVDYLYVASRYSTRDGGGNLCPWCIADGSAHSKYGIEFSDPTPLIDAGLSSSIVSEVTTRTPGYISWQQEIWLAHCNDACAFLGDATYESIKHITPGEKAVFIQFHGITEEWFDDMVERYVPGTQPAIYHFRCLHCGLDRFGMDYT